MVGDPRIRARKAGLTDGGLVIATPPLSAIFWVVLPEGRQNSRLTEPDAAPVGPTK